MSYMIKSYAFLNWSLQRKSKMFKSINRYVWIAVSSLAMFIFSPRRSQDPLGAAVIAVAGGVLVALLVLAMDFVKWATSRAKRSAYSALLLAAADGDIQSLETALAGGPKVDVRGPNGETALMLAARNGRIEAVQYLLAKGADKSLSTPKGSTAIELATRFGHQAVADLL